MRSILFEADRLRPLHLHRSRQGALLILGALFIILFCGFAAFAIDLGYIALTQAQLQNAADAAALAAVLELKDAGGMSRAEIRQKALDEALKAASFNQADGRTVVLDPTQIVFGNRHYDSTVNGFVTVFEPDPAVENLPLNAIDVRVVYGDESGDRRQLALFFAPVIDIKNATVSGVSRAHLTPRDLAFVIDISNSMNDHVQGGGTYQTDRYVMIRKWFDLDTSVNLTRSFRYNITVLQHDENSGRRSVTNLAENSGQFQLYSSNHGLETDDVVRVLRTSGSADDFSTNATGTWRVQKVDNHRFVLQGSTYAGAYTSGVVWWRKGIYPNTSGRVRVHLSAPHGLNDGAQIRLHNVQGLPNLDGTQGKLYRIARVDDSRFDLLTTGGTPILFDNLGTALGWNRDGHHIDRTGAIWLVPDRNGDDDEYKAAWLRSLDTNHTSSGGNNIWGTETYAEQVAAMEFPSGQTDPAYVSGAVQNRYGAPGDYPLNKADGTPYAYPQGHPWKHWKWKTFCDWCLFDADNNDYPGDVSSEEFNKNIISGSTNTSLSYDQYANFCLLNGYVPALRGQQMIGRDMNLDGNLDDFPSVLGAGYEDYPSFAGFYGKSSYLAGFDFNSIDFTEGSLDAGLHPLNVPDLPFSYVRQATLLGINAMISDENVGNDAFDQVGMLTYGTRANIELDLTNDLAEAIRRANCRCTVTGANLNISPAGNGNTNIGGAIREAIYLVKFSPRARSYTNKTIALLTDGQPNISPQGGYTGPEFQQPSGPDTFQSSNSQGEGYARYWANQAGAEGIVIHTIGVGPGATTGSPSTLLQEIADNTGGQYFPVSDPAGQQQTLNNIFIAIGKDKLGKLFSN